MYIFSKVPKKTCVGCSYPVCSKKCAEEHALKEECPIIAQHMPLKDMQVDYQAIMPLRCLLSKGELEWDYLQMFEDHCKVHSCTKMVVHHENCLNKTIEFSFHFLG